MSWRRFVLLPVAALLFTLAPLPAQEKDKAKAAAPALPAGFKLNKDLAYGAHARNKLDLYVPETTGKALPLVIWIHGGGWEGGSKDGGNPARGLLSKGYAVAAINYRLTDTKPFPAQIHDCKAAVRWLRAHAKEYGYDADRLGAYGASAGGHLVSLLGVSCDNKELEGDVGTPGVSSKVQAVCDWFGPTDFLNWGAPGVMPQQGYANKAIGKLMGGAIETKQDIAKLASPTNYVSNNCPPILFVHGDKDPLVPLQQSELLHEALKKAGVDSTLHVVVGGGHGPGFQAPEVAKAIIDFFARTLQAPATGHFSGGETRPR